VIHDFDEELEYSEKASEESFWFDVYKKAFPNMVNCMSGWGDTESQRKGIDRVILLANGKTLYVDEKKRRKVYRDFLLEYISVDKTGAPGWMEKELNIDYLAYAFMPIKRCYLLPWPLLRRAWLHFKNDWLNKYPIKPAENKGYKTLSVAVPRNIVIQAIKRAVIIQLPKNKYNTKKQDIKNKKQELSSGSEQVQQTLFDSIG